MSQPPPPASLLWVNKDASNVHRKKHVAEVNAHVQKGNTRHRLPSRSSDPRIDNAYKHTLPTRAVEYSESTQPGDSSSGEQQSSICLTDCSSRIACNSSLVFSHYSEDDVSKEPENLALNDGDLTLPTDSKLYPDSQQLQLSIHPGVDISNPLPTLLTGLSPHEKMLIHTHLTHMPRLVFGFSDRVVYCPIRVASVANIIRYPIATIWVLISLEMFLQTVRGGNERGRTIMRQKTRAYQIMSKTLTKQAYSDGDDDGAVISSIAAAIGELFCGDPLRALTHLNGVDAMLKTRGGLDYIRKMDVTASMPIYAIFAYRTLLQDNSATLKSFVCALSSFMSTIKAFVHWNRTMVQTTNLESPAIPASLTQDEVFGSVGDLSQARTRAFIDHPLVCKFTTAEIVYSKPGEMIDHFLILYNLILTLLDYSVTPNQAARFIEEFVQDVELGGSSPDENSSINVAGVHRLLMHRQVNMHVHSPGDGVARAWGALDALEIMKLLTSEQQKSVCYMLHALLVGDLDSVMGEEDLAIIESTVTMTWHLRHPDQKPA